MGDNEVMDRSSEIQELLLRLAASLKEEDLLESPELAEEIRAILQAIAPKNSLDPKVVAALSDIEDKKKRFLYAMKMLQVIPEPESMKALAQAMQEAGLLGPGEINSPGEDPEHEPLPQGMGEEPATDEDDGFDPSDSSPADEVEIDPAEVMRAAIHRR